MNQEKKTVMQTAGHFWAWYSVCMCPRPWQWGCSCCVESSPPAASKCEARDGGWSGTHWKRRSLQSSYAYHSKQEKFPNQSIQQLIILNMLGWCDMYTLCIDWTVTHTLFCNRNVCIRVYRYIQYIHTYKQSDIVAYRQHYDFKRLTSGTTTIIVMSTFPSWEITLSSKSSSSKSAYSPRRGMLNFCMVCM